MKRIALIIAACCLILTACAQNNNKTTQTTETKENKEMKTLIVYFSATGNTKAAAQRLAKEHNADLYEITPEVLYTAADLDWRDKTSRSTIEMQDKTSRPAIKGRCENIADYDTVWIGFPIWWYTAPTIVNTFIEAHDLSGKTLNVFATSGGSDVKDSYNDLKKAYPQYKWGESRLMNQH
jgi:flavodoxin